MVFQFLTRDWRPVSSPDVNLSLRINHYWTAVVGATRALDPVKAIDVSKLDLIRSLCNEDKIKKSAILRVKFRKHEENQFRQKAFHFPFFFFFFFGKNKKKESKSTGKCCTGEGGGDFGWKWNISRFSFRPDGNFFFCRIKKEKQ